MNRWTLYIFCLVFLGANSVIAEAHAAAGKKKSSSHHRTQQAQPRSHRSMLRQQASRSHSAMRRSREQIRVLESNLQLARNAEQSVRRRHDSNGGSSLRNAVRSATLERANLENQLTDVRQNYRDARASYQRARNQLRTERRAEWLAQSGAQNSRKPGGASKARTLKFASQPLGRTGSGSSQPNAKPKGILKTSSG